ncbi:hypothetical protein ALC56_14949 [Trachymyrmex septentrionalis]|uniref:Double jelly roll-like domain-containing protein n=1 Tax=Trachymyrmex septentrionalis TaxID=34720 RepID=A0A151JTQ1_9HYME|nr:hypothetical protein ALC56_14949 [Trachymyrmex septentrionalis]
MSRDILNIGSEPIFDDRIVKIETHTYNPTRNLVYDTYVKFQKTYYGYNNRDAMLSIGEFLVNGPFVVIDCSRQNKSIKSATIDIRIEFECKENIPLNITAYYSR